MGWTKEMMLQDQEAAAWQDCGIKSHEAALYGTCETCTKRYLMIYTRWINSAETTAYCPFCNHELETPLFADNIRVLAEDDDGA